MNGFFLRVVGMPAMVFCGMAVIFLLGSGCGGESEESVRRKLEVICADDLAAIIDSIAAEDLIEKPYYEVVFYQHYNEGSYSRKAVVDYYFLEKVRVKVVRKYRYHATIRMWDRYSNEYVFFHDTTGAAAGR
jgi:hypothetical protein